VVLDAVLVLGAVMVFGTRFLLRSRVWNEENS
jgi:hypothetical protein